MPNKRLSLFAASLLCIYAIIAICCSLTPLAADDFGYGIGPRDLMQLLALEYTHYMTWNSRSIATLINRILLIYPNILYILFNPLAYTGIIFSMLVLVFGEQWKNKVSWIWVFVIHTLLWFFLPRFGTTVLWRCGSANYMWPVFFAFLFLLPYRFLFASFYGSTKEDHALPLLLRWIAFPVMFVTGVLSGWSTENLGPVALLLASGCVLIPVLAKAEVFTFLPPCKTTVPLWAIAGIMGVITGVLFILLSPAIAIRMASDGQNHVSTAAFLLSSCKTFLKAQRYALVPYLLMALSLVALIKNKTLTCDKKALALWLIYLGAAFASVLPLMTVNSSFIVQRAFTVTFMFALLAALGALAHAQPALQLFVQNKSLLKNTAVAVLCLSIVGMSLFTAKTVRQLYKVYATDQIRTTLYTSGRADVTVPPYPYRNAYAFIGKEIRDISSAPDFWVNTAIASYYAPYGLKSVRLDTSRAQKP